MFAESNPGPVKFAASLLGFGTAACRLPLAPIADAHAKKMRDAMVEVGLLN
jgi:4-hydroxy-tetrahydrodipicolinate synthase